MQIIFARKTRQGNQKLSLSARGQALQGPSVVTRCSILIVRKGQLGKPILSSGGQQGFHTGVLPKSVNVHSPKPIQTCHSLQNMPQVNPSQSSPHLKDPNQLCKSSAVQVNIDPRSPKKRQSKIHRHWRSSSHVFKRVPKMTRCIPNLTNSGFLEMGK